MHDASIKSVTLYSKMEDEEVIKFEHFKVIKPIGKGTFGKVFLVHC